MQDDWTFVLAGIEADRVSSATALTQRAAEALPALAQSSAPLRDELRRLAAVRPPFASLLRLASEAARCATGTVRAVERRDCLYHVARAVRLRLRAEHAKIVAASLSLLGPGARVLTISASSLVRDVLIAGRELLGAGGLVTCLESRPGCEGATLATELAERGVPVRLAPDAAAARLVREADLVLLGGDTFCPSGLVHKLGTLGLALAAVSEAKPVYSLLGSFKLLPAPVRGWEQDGGPPDDLPGKSSDRLEVWNRFFDLTPVNLLAGVVSEKGLIRPEAAARLASRQEIAPWLLDLLEVASGRSPGR